ncbi:DUF2867 domain-containing protein [Pseudomonas plecoglossicida]|jgi:hypothetical protein|uniref:DUF2867 domain-containing protein n=3 Tax=Pseudomonas TaxID=286 RepID=A0ABX4U299_PSEDL|nr:MULTISPECIES: DUF2867 domain-containing protein [Pseudomonas]KXK70839.1 hypothetical protein BC89_11175 [Pseudomonas monteilii]GJB80894.1 hypothetical protein KAM380_053590 [Aeromonas caviae]AGA75669.1 hypothetical protein B479_23900 [Pseudomonas putida HB3267]KPM67850.1 hypothetical protein HB13667_04255 [Pseudomonas putida]MCE0751266.1 DUF2867 domain-containing protein [Pseudomonas asiatica]
MSAQLVAAKACLDFLHTDSVQLTVPLTALQAYCAMTSDVPGWLALAFQIRDYISRRFNVADIHGFTRRDPEHVPAVGEGLDFFTVEAISDQQLVLTSRDTHLAVMVCMDVSTGECGFPQLNVTTSVKCFNTFGRLYMVPVGWVHGVIVRRMLSNLQGHRFERR